MKKKGMLLAVAILFLAACAPRNADRESSQKLIRENEQRLATLENSVTALNSQVAQLNNRVYEVRTRNGQKTSMTVVPIAKSAPAATEAPAAAHARPKAQPRRGRKINPAAKPAQLASGAAPKTASASGSIGVPANSKGATGHIGDNSELALPPDELPAQTPPPVPQGNVPPVPSGNTAQVQQGNASQAVPPAPVPLIPPSDLSLPPEHPGLPQNEAQAAKPQNAASTPAKATLQKASARHGEQAAYNAALNAARSGRPAEGIQKFRDFLKKYPNGKYAANAEYWIGECLYAQGKYKEALSEFQGVNNSYPSHHKNADALLKAGMTLSKMGDKDGASEKFKALIANFPNSEAARRARAMGAR